MPTRQFEMRSIAVPAQVECETFHPQRKQTLFDSERSFGTMNWALASPHGGVVRFNSSDPVEAIVQAR